MSIFNDDSKIIKNLNQLNKNVTLNETTKINYPGVANGDLFDELITPLRLRAAAAATALALADVNEVLPSLDDLGVNIMFLNPRKQYIVNKTLNGC